MPNVIFKAPWGALLTIITLIASVILVGIPVFALANNTANTIAAKLVLVLLPLGIFIGCALFLIRGYIISNDTLFVQRSFWNNAIDLSTLESVDVNPHAMEKSIRTFGNGGLFSFSGRYRNKQLGLYRAFATKLDNSVVLKFSDQTIVVTPDQPQRFANELKQMRNLK